MEALIERLHSDARYLGEGILKVDSFLNHLVDTELMMDMGGALALQLMRGGASGLTRVVTAETSGIPPALATAHALGIPMIYARKKRPVTFSEDYYASQTRSHTKGDIVTLHIAAEYLTTRDRVVLIDDFLGTGETTLAIIDLIEQSGATLCGLGFVLEKVYEQGRTHLGTLQVPVIALAAVDLDNDTLVVRQNH